MTAQWRPLGHKNDDADDFSALHEGVPAWLEKSIREWCLQVLNLRASESGGVDGLIAQMERQLRTQIPVTQSSSAGKLGDILRRFRESQERLTLVDYLLSGAEDVVIDNFDDIDAGLDDRAWDDEAWDVLRLKEILEEGGSAYKIAFRYEGILGLVRRLPSGSQELIEAAIAQSGKAGLKLGQAYGAAFGRSPDYSKAYSMAIKAIEDAAIPRVSPKDKKATLGTVIGQMKADASWKLPMTREDPEYPTSTLLLAMAKTVWQGQIDRHGGVHDAVITKQEAEIAVVIASALVQWFSNEYVSN